MTNAADEELIRSYMAELEGAADLVRCDRTEIEEHLRALATDLRATGLSQRDAIAEACRRLGKPSALAREYARVHSPFGARLSRARAWSAAALLAWWWLDFVHLALWGPGLSSIFGVNAVISTFALVGLVARARWARPIIFGALSWFVLDSAIDLVFHGLHGIDQPWASACKAGALLFVMPWSIRELAAAGWAIALLAWTYHGVNQLAAIQLTGPDRMPFATPGLTLAFVGAVAAGVGVMVRARWASVTAGAAALGLVLGYAELRTLTFRVLDPTLAQVHILGGIAVGAFAAVIVAALAWRFARSAFGNAEAH